MPTVMLVGLGNPGREYDNTRHNVGFFAIDVIASALAQQTGTPLQWQLKKNFLAEVASFVIDDRTVLLVKPQTYMNQSGKSVSAIQHFYNIDARDTVVIYDELDLPLGRIQIREGGTTAGHNGLKSIIEHIKTDQFARVRIGIRGDELRRQHKQIGMETHNFVLGRFSRDEDALLDKVVHAIVQELPFILTTPLKETKNISTSIDS